MDHVRFVTKAEITALRPGRAGEGAYTGLYAAGEIDGLCAPTVAVVGTRGASRLGRRLAHDLAACLGSNGVCVVSGLALGIDGAAHEGALAASAPTIAVLGGGHHRLYPRAHRPLAARIIAAGGAVLSPYAPDEAARPGQFLARNGIVALLADAVIVVEAGYRSGALNTASWAAASSIPVGAFPGDPDRAGAAGCNALIRDGATLVRGAADVLELIGRPACGAIDRRSKGGQEPPAGAPADLRSPLDGTILRALARGPLTIAELERETNACAADLAAALVKLELRGALDRDGTRINAT